MKKDGEALLNKLIEENSIKPRRKLLQNRNMKSFSVISLIILLSGCSFDNKSGIWKNKNISLKHKLNLRLKI